MKLALPPKGVPFGTFTLVTSRTRTIRKLLLGLSLLTLSFLTQAQSESKPEIIKAWNALEEADFYFDVSFTVVKCSAESSPIVLLNAFNEGGRVTSIGFTLKLTDAKGKSSTIEIEKFDIPFGKMFIAACDSEDYSNLKFMVPEGMDPATLSIDITYNK